VALGPPARRWLARGERLATPVRARPGRHPAIPAAARESVGAPVHRRSRPAVFLPLAPGRREEATYPALL